MKKIDFHLHSHYSDGSDSMPNILDRIKKEGITLFSITDHNFIAPELKIFQKVAEGKKIKFIQGIEISCIDKKTGQSIHILGYSRNFDIENINKNLKFVIDQYNNRAKKIINKLNKDYSLDFDFEKIKSNITSTIISRNLLAEMLIKHMDKNLSMKEALKKAFLDEDDSWMPDVKETISIIKKNGGQAFLAHPGNLIDQIDFDDLLKRLKDFGLNGMEVYYRKHGERAIKFLEEKSHKFDLIKSGGSDWHGETYSDFPPGINVDEDTYNDFYNLFFSKK